MQGHLGFDVSGERALKVLTGSIGIRVSSETLGPLGVHPKTYSSASSFGRANGVPFSAN